jgi:hypothetical protein
VAVCLWPQRRSRGAPVLIAIMVSTVVWTLGYALEMGCAELPAKLLWAKVQYLGICATPILWLTFACQYTRRFGRWWRSLPLLTLEPVVVVSLVWTNHLHHLYWRDTILEYQEGFSLLVVLPGLSYPFHVAYAYLLILVSMYASSAVPRGPTAGTPESSWPAVWRPGSATGCTWPAAAPSRTSIRRPSVSP